MLPDGFYFLAVAMPTEPVRLTFFCVPKPTTTTAPPGQPPRALAVDRVTGPATGGGPPTCAGSDEKWGEGSGRERKQKGEPSSGMRATGEGALFQWP